MIRSGSKMSLHDPLGQRLGPSGVSGVDLGVSGGGLGSLRGLFWSLLGASGGGIGSLRGRVLGQKTHFFGKSEEI